MRRLAVITMASTLLLTGCSGAGALDDVKIGGGANPSVEVPEGFETSSTKTRVIEDGGGEEVAEGDSVKVNYVAVNGRTGEQFDNSFSGDSSPTVPLVEGGVLPGFIKGLEGQKVGSRVLVAISPDDGFGGPQESLAIQADDSLVFLFDIVSKVPREASGEEQDVPSSVPQLTLDDGVPTGFEDGSKVADDPQEPSLHVAIKGDGDEIEEGASVTAHYIGQIYPDGEIFDGSWERGTPSSFSLEEVVPCWKNLVPGQTVGSRVIVTCPPDSAYGDSPPEGSAIKAGDTLVFAIDLLDAS